MLCRNPEVLYAAFDVFPSRKGAAIHIGQFAPALFSRGLHGLLYVLNDGTLPRLQTEDGFEIVRVRPPASNYLDRAFHFGAELADLVARHGSGLRLAHFRDIWSAGPLLQNQRRHAALFEVNALPSIELPCSYDRLDPVTLAKVRALEAACLGRADHLVTPSQVLRDALVNRGVAADKITVIPNGADLPAPQPRPAGAPPTYLLYFGALQPWQGLDVLLRAFARLADLPAVHLVICASHATRRSSRLRQLADDLRVSPRVHWHVALAEAELAPWREHAALSIAPLTECPRNLEQGCAPLKILESMAAGVPVVASDLPAVRELMHDGEHGRLVRPDRPGELARAVRVLLHYPELRRSMGARAQAHVRNHFLWSHALARLQGVYSELLARPPAPMFSPGHPISPPSIPA